MNVTDLQGAGLFTPYEEMDAHLVAELKCRVMDVLIALAGGAIAVDPEEYREVCSLADGAPTHRAVYPAELKTSLPMAAFLDGYLIRFADWGDTYRRKGGIGGHPSDVFAAILALCDDEGISGRSVLELTNLAYQLYAAMQEGMFYKKKRGYDYTTCVGLVTPVVASVACGDTPEATQNALNLSASGALVLEQVRPGDITNLKNAATSYAVARGLWCRNLGRVIKAPASMFGGEFGWYVNILPMDGELRGRGIETYDGVEMKTFSCYNAAQAASECAVNLRRQLPNGDSSAIKKISLAVSRVDYDIVAKAGLPEHPASHPEADHHIRYCAATALRCGALTPLHYTEECIRNAETARLIDITQVRALTDEEAAELDHQDGACLMAAELADGSTLRYGVSKAVGIIRGLRGEERIRRLRSVIESKVEMVKSCSPVDLSKVAALVDELENHSGRELIDELSRALQVI